MAECRRSYILELRQSQPSELGKHVLFAMVRPMMSHPQVAAPFRPSYDITPSPNTKAPRHSGSEWTLGETRLHLAFELQRNHRDRSGAYAFQFKIPSHIFYHPRHRPAWQSGFKCLSQVWSGLKLHQRKTRLVPVSGIILCKHIGTRNVHIPPNLAEE